LPVGWRGWLGVALPPYRGRQPTHAPPAVGLGSLPVRGPGHSRPPQAFAPLAHRRCGLAPARRGDCPLYSRLPASCRLPAGLPPPSRFPHKRAPSVHSVKEGRTRRGSATHVAGMPPRAARTISLGLLDLLNSLVCLLFHFFRAPRRRSLTFVHGPYSSVLPLL